MLATLNIMSSRTVTLLLGLAPLTCASSTVARDDIHPHEGQDQVPESVRMMEEMAQRPTLPARALDPKYQDSQQGTLSKSEIQETINTNIEHVQRCYEAELARNPRVQGKVQMDWVIGIGGSVTDVGWQSSDLPSTMVACIAAKIRTWKFPRPQGGPVNVHYPFSFMSRARSPYLTGSL